MTDREDMFLRARGRTFSGLTAETERRWTGPFCFVVAADPQLGLMKAWREGDSVSGGDEWEEEVQLTRQAVEAVNQLRPRPRFMALCGDLVNAMPGTHFRKAQERDLKDVLKGIDPSIPLVLVSGNHDLDQVPTPSTLEQYCRAWGDDYFSFWVGGVFCLVLNSQLFFDASACPQEKRAQDEWLQARLSSASSTEPKPKHILVFQHIPLYVKSPDEENQYMSLHKDERQRLTEQFKRAGVTAVFSGHCHRNGGGCHDGLEMVVTSAIGCQLGDDTHGVRLVAVTADAVVHRYYTLEQLRDGMDTDLRKLLTA